MKWYVVDMNYVSYLRKFETKVQNNNYPGKLKPFVGIVLSVNDLDYYVPVSSPKKKHRKMKENIDFIKIEDQITRQLYCVINLNNMIPISNTCVKFLNYSDVSNYISFESSKAQTNYINLLQNEINIINKKKEIIQSKANKLRNICILHPESSLAKRSCDFLLLEQKCQEYSIQLSQTQQPILPNQIPPVPTNEFTQGI